MTKQEKVPLERLLFSADIDGNQGYNRAAPDVTKQIEAVNDLDAIKAWLAESRNVLYTLRNYRDPTVVYLPANDDMWYDAMKKHKIVKNND